jgi:transposase-like protein
MIAFKEVIMAEFKVPRAGRWTPEQARAVLDEIDRRGVSVNRFAADNGLGVERLYRWKRLLGRRGRSSQASVPRFAELTVRPRALGALIEIELPGGVAVRIGGETRVEDAVAILSRLAAR